MKKFILFLMLIAAPAWGDTVTFEWDANTEPDLAGYRLYINDNMVREIQGTETTIELNGDWEAYLTAFDETGNESGPSNKVDNTIPEVPKGMKVKVTVEVEF